MLSISRPPFGTLRPRSQSPPATDTKADDAVPGAPPLHFVAHRDQQAGARAPYRMPQRNPPLHVHFAGIHAQILDARHRLSGKGLVEFDQIYVRHFEPGFVQEFFDSRAGP